MRQKGRIVPSLKGAAEQSLPSVQGQPLQGPERSVVDIIYLGELFDAPTVHEA
ncbi:hypothetical protein ACLOJK_010975 [Asimina triloba]